MVLDSRHQQLSVLTGVFCHVEHSTFDITNIRMAHAHTATLDNLSQSLVTCITGHTPDDASFKTLSDAAWKGLRHQSHLHARTNQFAVKARMDGLIEKLLILSRDDLAEALQSRLGELQGKGPATSNTSKYTPEVLALLLELSDRPAEKTPRAPVEDMERSQVDQPGALLTWEDIVADDPPEDSAIWDHVDAGYHSSGEELGSGPEEDDDTQPTLSTTPTSVSGDDPAALARLHLIHPDESYLAEIKAQRATWQDQPSPASRGSLPELQLVRETLTMLQGYPTDLFLVDTASGRVTLARKIPMACTSDGATMSLLNGCAKSGSGVNFLRIWVRSAQPATHIRTMQSTVRKLLTALALQLTGLEQRYVSSHVSTVVSIVDVAGYADEATRPLVHLASIIQIFSLSDGRTSQLSLLDSLYDQACAAQSSEDTALFMTLAVVFLDGLKTYLRPIVKWIMTGTLLESVQGIPLVKEFKDHCEPENLWHGRYAMNLTRDGNPFTPKCIHMFAQRIFSLGKIRSFLHCLDLNADDDHVHFDLNTHLPNFDHLPQLQSDSLMSFPHLLDQSLQRWIDEISIDCTPLLRSKLWHEHGLAETLLALPYVYFSKNGTAFQAFADTLVERMTGHTSQQTWCDPFLLGEFAQTAFSNLPHVDYRSLQVRILARPSSSANSSTMRKLAAFDLEYVFNWPLQNLTRCRTSATHARAFAFLLQLHLASSLLRQSFLGLRSVPRTSDVVPMRQKLINFTDTVHSYVTNAAGSIHERMLSRLESVHDVDSMVSIWSDYTKSLETGLVLSAKLEPLRDAITGMLELSELLIKSNEPEKISFLQAQFETNIGFLVAGLRGVSRAGGEAALEILADRLEWSAR